MIKQLKKVGNSNAIILDKALIELVGLEENGEIQITVHNGSIIITPIRPKQVDPERFEAFSVVKGNPLMLPHIAIDQFRQTGYQQAVDQLIFKIEGEFGRRLTRMRKQNILKSASIRQCQVMNNRDVYTFATISKSRAKTIVEEKQER